MKKSLKLFSSLLALGMMLGTGAGSLSAAAQQEAGTTVSTGMTKLGALEEPSVPDKKTVRLDPNQITTAGFNNVPCISDVAWNDGQKEALLEGGTLEIPEVDKEGKVIKGVDHFAFSKEELNAEAGDSEGMKEVVFENPENIEYIGQEAFKGHQLTEVKLPNIKLIYAEAFADNKLKTVVINEDYELDDTALKGSVYNPQINSDAFLSQNWGDLSFDYQSTISVDELANKLNLTFSINKHNMATVNAINSLGPDADNITVEDSQELKVNSENGGTATVELFHGTSPISALNGSAKLIVNAREQPAPGPGPDGNGGGNGGSQPDNGNNGNESGTNPDTGNGGGNNGNETKPQPAPKPEEKRPHTVYAKRGMRLHRNVSLTSPIRSYKKQSRAKAASFRVRGIEYDKNGKKRYKVDGGYITAGSSYVADSHFRSNKVRQVRVLSNRVNSYKDVKLSSNKKVRSYKKGTKLRVKRVVNWGRATRFELTNGRYITGNKQLLIMDQN
ncbi:DUF5776 domain-containing protein [Secundilactobacillus mixtipabuli]|uniref:DUF5776 domain-containing protein n=1 Tax=Secundilactobacillus mixtipabuli TaxID=1435342 RepID=A0A1Z5I9F9_9LACO|nr:DUF5776 domain-containing protein [Secundilactobacillus mixtipabuli]GAW98215.1 hypothetical protein IWT30_00158 [Secundilactobacillus mixtipabuli]